MSEERIKKSAELLFSIVRKQLKNGKQGKQKTWSEEDEKMCQETIDWFEKKCFPYALENDNPARESIKWLKSLKNRVLPQPKHEWSEEDREYMESLLDIINGTPSLTPSEVECHKDWLKNLKQRIGG